MPIIYRYSEIGNNCNYEESEYNYVYYIAVREHNILQCYAYLLSSAVIIIIIRIKILMVVFG